MRCYAPVPAGRAISAPQTSWLDFGGGKEWENGAEWKGMERRGQGKERERENEERKVAGREGREEEGKGKRKRGR